MKTWRKNGRLSVAVAGASIALLAPFGLAASLPWTGGGTSDNWNDAGNWGGTPGTLTITGVNIPSTGAYTITIYFVHIDGEINRAATVTVSGNSALNLNFVGSATCCQTKVLANLTIAAGVHTILFANSTGHAPSIDKVVVSRS